MGKVGTGAVRATMRCVNTFYSNEHFTGEWKKTLTFTAKGQGTFFAAVNGQYYGRSPTGMIADIKKNQNFIGRAFGNGDGFQSVAAVTDYQPGDVIQVLVQVSHNGSGDAGCDYWVSASANEEIHFVET